MIQTPQEVENDIKEPQGDPQPTVDILDNGRNTVRVWLLSRTLSFGAGYLWQAQIQDVIRNLLVTRTRLFAARWCELMIILIRGFL